MYFYFQYGLTFPKISLNKIALTTTGVIIIIALVFPEFFTQSGTSYAILALLLAGIIHGASDYFIYKAIGNKPRSLTRNVWFNLLYLLVIVLYAVVWYFSPAVALLIFLGVSTYHFGQSNWHHYTIPEPGLRYIMYLAWGVFVVFTPLILHLEEAKSNLLAISDFGGILKLTPESINVYILFFVNVLLISILRVKNHLSTKEYLKELINLSQLFILFMTVPLLVGFAIYFVFWHSTYSTAEQIKILKSIHQTFSLQNYFRSILIISFITFLILGGIYLLFTNVWEFSFEWGMLFLFISLLTLPHSHVINKIYESW